jgi:hypothetical protein
LRKWEKNFLVESGHAKSATELFDYDPVNEVKLDLTNHTIRGIPCEAWQHEVETEVRGKNMSFLVTQHFVKNEWTVIEEFHLHGKNKTTPRPLARLEVKHLDNGHLDSWDFVGMKPYAYDAHDFDPCNMFEKVYGCGCDRPFRNTTDHSGNVEQTPPMAEIYPDWSASVEETFSEGNESFTRNEIFSQSQKKMRIEWGTGADKHVLIEDFDLGIKYRMSKNETYPNGKCWSYTKADEADNDYYMKDGYLRSSEWLLGYNATEEKYITGNHHVRNVPVDIWERTVTWSQDYLIYHAFAREDWSVSSYYNRSAFVQADHPAGERPLTRIVLARANDTDHRYTFDYLGMQRYKYDPTDFDHCSVFQGVDGCGCGDPKPTGGDNPYFPGLKPEWESVINTVHPAEKFQTTRKEIYSALRDKYRVDLGHTGDKSVYIEDLRSNKIYHVHKNSTYPNGYCHQEVRSSFTAAKEDKGLVSTHELVSIYNENTRTKADLFFMSGDHVVRGMPTNCFRSDLTSAEGKWHLHYYFTKNDWTKHYFKGQSKVYIDRQEETLVRITMKNVFSGVESHYDFIDMQTYAYSAADFDPCKVAVGVEGCGCDSPLKDLICNSMTEEEVAGMAAGLFFLGLVVSMAVSCLYCKLRRSRRSSALSYSKYNDNGI